MIPLNNFSILPANANYYTYGIGSCGKYSNESLSEIKKKFNGFIESNKETKILISQFIV